MNNRSSASFPITVSIIIATYNRAHYLTTALNSIFNQTRLPDEIFIVDDGSTDDTCEVVNRYGTGCRYAKIQNGGKSAALNFAIPQTHGSHIWIFDDDDVALPDALQSHLDFLAAHPDADFSYSTNYVYDGEGDIWQQAKWRSKSIPDRSPHEFMIRTMERMNTLLQGMLIPRRCFLEVGPFDETLLRAQDHEMLIRLTHRFRGLNIGRPTFVLRQHQGPRAPQLSTQIGDQLSAIQLHYQQRIFRKIRDTYPLSCYLSTALESNQPQLDNTQRRQALLQRACIMLRQGLLDEALEDLEAGLTCLKPGSHPMDGVDLILSKALDVEPWMLPHRYYLVIQLSKILKATDAKTLAPVMARGMYWSLKRSLRKHLWRDATHSVAMLGLTVVCNVYGFVIRYIANPQTSTSEV